MIEARPASPEDHAFLFELYASTRREELAAWGWDPAQQNAFLQMQFLAQTRAYEGQYSGAEHRILWQGGQRMGRTLVARSESEIHLVDIALLPEFRGQGHGTTVLRELQAEAAATGKPLRLSVLSQSPARRLYQRLGFDAINDDGLYCSMVWQTPTQSM